MNGVLLFAGAIFILWLGSSIFVPLLVATFFWYLINATATYYGKLFPSTKHPLLVKIISNILSIGTFVGLIYLFATRVRPMFSELLAMMPDIQAGLNSMWHYVSDKFGIDITSVAVPSITSIASNIGSSVARLATSMGMVLVYMLFMFIEQSTFHRKFAVLFPNRGQGKKARYIIHSIDENMKKYLFTKTAISAATGITSYILLKMIGLEYASVWGFILFLLNYIPTIGSILACILPIAYALITHDTWQIPVFTTIALVFVETLFGNILDPKFTGKTLNISSLAILINLVFWGMIWGPAGMFFSVPILVALYVTTAQFESTRWIATLLSANGHIPDETQSD